jgi:CRISPR-associated protein Csb2
VRFTLAGRPLPPIEDAVRIGEIVRAALIRIADHASNGNGVPQEISGHGASTELDHHHAFYLPEDADGDGLIDHVLVHASGGLTQTALAALRRLRRLWLDDGHEWHVVYEGQWDVPVLSESIYAQESRVWVSATPYLHPWYAKKSFGRAEQIARECAGRGLPVPVDVRILSSIHVRGRDRRPVHFHRFRSRRGLRQPDTCGGDGPHYVPGTGERSTGAWLWLPLRPGNARS